MLPACAGVYVLQGSGLSDGKWVTLGAHEVEDLGVVVRHLRSQGGVSSIGLWGRSMGAVTALLYSHSDPDIAGMVGVLLHGDCVCLFGQVQQLWQPACSAGTMLECQDWGGGHLCAALQQQRQQHCSSK